MENGLPTSASFIHPHFHSPPSKPTAKMSMENTGCPIIRAPMACLNSKIATSPFASPSSGPTLNCSHQAPRPPLRIPHPQRRPLRALPRLHTSLDLCRDRLLPRPEAVHHCSSSHQFPLNSSFLLR